MNSDGEKLHQKFKELNEETSAAIQTQQDAVATASTLYGRSNFEAARKDAFQLAKKTTEWRGDVGALAKQIDVQLEHSRALRSDYAQSLLRSSDWKQQERAEGSRLRRLRSDLRLLQDFRMHYSCQRGKNDPTLLASFENETKQLEAFIDIISKKERTGGVKEQAASAVELYEMRRDIMCRISEDFVAEKKQLDAEAGNPDALYHTNFGNSAMREKYSLASLDTQLYVILMQTLQDLQKGSRDRLAAKSQNSMVSFAGANDAYTIALDLQAVSATQAREKKSEAPGDDFAMQRFEREVAELKVTNSKLMLTNSQLKDDLVHLQTKYDEEMQAHLNVKQCIFPKMQQMENELLCTAKAFEEVKISVELMTNMYKQLCSTMTLQQEGEDELKQERSQVSLLLAGEIKKVAALKKDNELKDRLITLTMAARYEMMQCANRHEKLAKEASEQCKIWESRAFKAETELATNQHQLNEAIQRFEATRDELINAKKSIDQLQAETQATVQAAAIKEAELVAASDKEQAALQQKLDKTKRDLMESAAKMLNLDSRLRKAQERLLKKAADAKSE